MTHTRSSRPSRIGPVAAALLSALIPGWGQYAAGRRRMALVMFRVLIVAAALALAAALAGPTQIAVWLLQPTVLLVLLGLNVLFLLFRMFAVWDAWRGAGGSSGSSVLVVMLAVLMLFVAVPHVALGWGQVRTYSVLTTVFGGNSDGGTAAGDTTTTTSTPSTTGGGASSTVSSTTTTAPTTTTSTVPWQGRDRLNLLLLGGDAGPGRYGIRTDTMIVASIGLKEGDVALFGFPRGLTNLKFPDGSRFTGYSRILNEVYPYGLQHPDRFPGKDAGATAIKQMLEGMTGLQIDYYVLVNLQAFVDVVNAIGGVTIYVPQTIVDNAYPREDGTTIKIRIEKGVHHFDGTHALEWVRSRHSSDDYHRMARQRCFLTAVADQANVPKLLRGLPTLLDTIEKNVTTDIPLSALPALVELAGKVHASSATVVGFGPPAWTTGYDSRRYPIPNVAKIKAAVADIIANPAEAQQSLGSSVDTAGDACGYGSDSTTPEEPSTTTTATSVATAAAGPTTTAP